MMWPALWLLFFSPSLPSCSAKIQRGLQRASGTTIDPALAIATPGCNAGVARGDDRGRKKRSCSRAKRGFARGQDELNTTTTTTATAVERALRPPPTFSALFSIDPEQEALFRTLKVSGLNRESRDWVKAELLHAGGGDVMGRGIRAADVTAGIHVALLQRFAAVPGSRVLMHPAVYALVAPAARAPGLWRRARRSARCLGRLEAAVALGLRAAGAGGGRHARRSGEGRAHCRRVRHRGARGPRVRSCRCTSRGACAS